MSGQIVDASLLRAASAQWRIIEEEEVTVLRAVYLAELYGQAAADAQHKDRDALTVNHQGPTALHLPTCRQSIYIFGYQKYVSIDHFGFIRRWAASRQGA